MEKILCVVSQGATREIQGQQGPSSVVDATLTDGINTFLVSAFDAVAIKMTNNPLHPGAIINADLEFKVSSSQKDGKNYEWQRVRLRNYGVLM